MQRAGLVSTVIPVHDRPAGLREAVDSVLAQDYRPIEILIVDDGSVDTTPDVAADYERRYPGIVRVVRQANAGPGVARESGRRIANGEYLQYLDSDDVLLDGKFAAQVAALARAPEADVAYGWIRFRDADGQVRPEPWKGSGEARDFLFPSILVERWWDTSAPLYRTKICDRAGPWLPLWQEEDWEYDCRIGALGARLAYVAAWVSETRCGADNRLSARGLDPHVLRNRAAAHKAMYSHADASGLSRESPEFAAFARRLFLLSRQCGAACLPAESSQLFALARRASTADRRGAFDFRVYSALSALLGWSVMGRMSQWMDAVRTR